MRRSISYTNFFPRMRKKFAKYKIWFTCLVKQKVVSVLCAQTKQAIYRFFVHTFAIFSETGKISYKIVLPSHDEWGAGYLYSFDQVKLMRRVVFCAQKKPQLNLCKMLNSNSVISSKESFAIFGF